jgi:dolichol-phosphate mannosyltransferase
VASLNILVPCYDEEPSLPSLVGRLEPVVADLARRDRVTVTCIDDGSRDGTAEAVRRLAAEHPWLALLRHEHNRGLGAAIRTGIAHNDHDLVAMLDADGSYSPADLPSLLAKLAEGFDIVIGSPYHPEGSVHEVGALRLALSRSLSAVYRRLTRSTIHTFSSIFRVYRREVFDRIAVRHDGFAAVADLLLQALRAGFRVAEVPATLATRAHGESRMRVVPEIRNHLGLIWRIWATRGERADGRSSGGRAVP